MVPNVDDASTSHNVFNERLEDAYFDASTSFHDPSNVHTFYQPYPHEKKWTKGHPLHKIIGDPKSSVRARGCKSHNVFNERLEDAYFDASTSFYDPSNVHIFYQPYPREKRWTKDHPLHKIIGDPKSSVRARGWTHVDPNLLNDFNMATNGNGDNHPPPEGGDLPVPDLRTMEELCQPTLNGRGGPKIVALKAKMAEINKNLMKMLQINQQVKAVTPSCETCGGLHYYNNCPATVGQTQNVYATGAYNQGGNSYQPQGNRNLLCYRLDNYLGPPGFN
nr:hypothetical protein [Tanacetum cinerariifolium]